MPYLFLDPLGDYAGYLKQLPDRLGLEAVVLFSSKARFGAWKHKWSRHYGQHVVGEYLVDGDMASLSRKLRAAHPEGFFGLVPWDELHTVTAAEVADALDLDWNPPHVVERFRDKAVMKAWLRKEGSVRINKSLAVTNAEQAKAFQASVGTWPIVVKPTGGAGAMSVFFAQNQNELLHGCQQVMESGLGEVLLEEFIGGDEFAVNGLVDSDGELLVTDIWYYDKRDSHGERNLYYQSVKVSTFEEPFSALADYASGVVRAMGLRRSPVHLEIKVDARGPCLIEVGARFAGGDQPVLASKLHHHNLFELAACHYLDDLPFSPNDVDYAHYNRYSARILSGIQPVEIGRIRAVFGVEHVENLSSFAGIGFIRPPGVRLPATKDLNTKSWEVYLFHPDERQVQRDAHAVRQLIRYL
ncbi:MAG: ATP-grasp domain-containing protein [Acidobacteriota bacterium]